MGFVVQTHVTGTQSRGILVTKQERVRHLWRQRENQLVYLPEQPISYLLVGYSAYLYAFGLYQLLFALAVRTLLQSIPVVHQVS